MSKKLFSFFLLITIMFSITYCIEVYAERDNSVGITFVQGEIYPSIEKIKVNIQYYADDCDNIIGYAALYHGNIMEQVQSLDIYAGEGEDTCVAIFDYCGREEEFLNNEYKIKIFVWNNNLQPFTDACYAECVDYETAYIETYTEETDGMVYQIAVDTGEYVADIEVNGIKSYFLCNEDDYDNYDNFAGKTISNWWSWCSIENGIYSGLDYGDMFEAWDFYKTIAFSAECIPLKLFKIVNDDNDYYLPYNYSLEVGTHYQIEYIECEDGYGDTIRLVTNIN